MAVTYKPGEEPERIKKRLDILFPKLDNAYPDKVIISLSKDHPKWAETITELYRILGYNNNEDFLNAYGYTVKRNVGGRTKSFDPNTFIEEMKRKYPNGSDFYKLSDLIKDNPWFTSWKTLQNESNDFWGMPLVNYLKSIGILKTKTTAKAENAEISILSKYSKYDFCTVIIPGMKQPVFALKSTSRIVVGDYININIGFSNTEISGIVKSIKPLSEAQTTIALDKLPVIKEKTNLKKYTEDMQRNILFVNSIGSVGNLLSRTTLCEIGSVYDNKAVSMRDGGIITSACCRGLASEIMTAADYLVHSDPYVYSYDDVVFTACGIAEMLVFCDDAERIIKNFPNLKVALFIEYENDKKIAAGYSESGYNCITDHYIIGNYDLHNENRYSLNHSPAEKSFFLDTDKKECYTFKHLEDWLSLNYIVNVNGITMEMEGELI